MPEVKATPVVCEPSQDDAAGAALQRTMDRLRHLEAARDREEAKSVQVKLREEALSTREEALVAREAEVARQLDEVRGERRLAEQRLADREQKIDERGLLLAEREQKVADREERLHSEVRSREQRLDEREDEVRSREQRLDEREAEVRNRERELDVGMSQLRLERKQMDERELQRIEAMKDAQVFKPGFVRVPPRLSPRGGKENHDLRAQLQEQQDKMHDIKVRARADESSAYA